MNRYISNFHIALLLIGLYALPSCNKLNSETEIQTEYCLDDFIKGKMNVDTAKVSPVIETLALTGKVEYNPDRVIHFTSLVGGMITNTYFHIGEEVKKGELLAEIRSTELSSLLAQKRSYQSQIKVAERELHSIKTMHQDNIASQKDLLEAQSTVEILIAELENIEAHLRLYSASTDRDVFQIKAPSSGTIVSKNIKPGMQISAEGDPLFTISNLDEVWIMADIYPGNISYVKENMAAEIRAFAYDNEIFNGHIDAISQVFDEEERVLKARIVMDNSTKRLIPGMFVDVLVEKKLGASAVSVPTKSLIFDNDQHFLIVYKDDCNIELRSVVPSVQNNDQVFFESGLNAGEQIITKNHLLIYNQLRNLN